MKTYMSLFSSAGIGCYGFKQSGFQCVATNELIPRRLEIQRANKKCVFDSGYVLGSIEDIEIENQLQLNYDLWKNTHDNFDLDVLIATPPCQGISVANHKKKDDEIIRNSLVVLSINEINKYLPKFFILENVLRFLKAACTDNDGEVKTIAETIDNNLSNSYNISSRVINFKSFGANSSRTRTLVIGIRKDLKSVVPNDFFPEESKEKSLKRVIGHLPSLFEMGEIDETDIYHSFRPYQKHMFAWIENTKYGKSAFDNSSPILKPHRVIDGEIIPNKNKNGDKYKRQIWEKVAPCIHTRNDILASQNTVHPEDNRVFSVRELMLMMNIPKSFRWVKQSTKKLNEMTFENKTRFIKIHDVNIRQCLGEAVPTIIFKKIADKIGDYLEE